MQKIFALKGRPSHNPLIVHVTDKDMAQRYGQWNALADELAEMHWPGALTLVLPLKANSPIAPSVLAGGNTIALRCPAHPIMREVLIAFDRGLAAPSANRSGRISPTSARHVIEEFPEAELLVMDGGSARIGIESTVVDCTGSAPATLRVGSINLSQWERSKTAPQLSGAGPHSKSEISISPSGRDKFLRAPGQLASHYAPCLPVRMNADSVDQNEALLAFGPPISGAAETANLSPSGDLDEAAQNLYAMLRSLDSPAHARIAVMSIPNEGVGIAINDRLQRAAADRPLRED